MLLLPSASARCSASRKRIWSSLGTMSSCGIARVTSWYSFDHKSLQCKCDNMRYNIHHNLCRISEHPLFKNLWQVLLNMASHGCTRFVSLVYRNDRKRLNDSEELKWSRFSAVAIFASWRKIEKIAGYHLPVMLLWEDSQRMEKCGVLIRSCNSWAVSESCSKIMFRSVAQHFRLGSIQVFRYSEVLRCRKLAISSSQFCILRKATMRDWWELCTFT